MDEPMRPTAAPATPHDDDVAGTHCPLALHAQQAGTRVEDQIVLLGRATPMPSPSAVAATSASATAPFWFVVSACT
jgi:hypothetical protein